MPSADAASIGRRAEDAAARKYGLVRDSNAVWDLRHPENGYKYSVKACRTERSGGYPGRFRVWEDSHRAFRMHRGAYILVVYDGESGSIWRIEKVSQDRMTEAIGGNWYAAEHADKGSRQTKLPWRDVLS